MTRVERLRGRSSVALIATALVATLVVVAVLVLYGLFGAGGGVLPDLAAEILLASVVAGVVSSVFAVPLLLLTLRNRDAVDEVFLVHESGLLMVHLSKTLKSEKDRDVLAGMLTAVQAFIVEAFASGQSRDLRQMDFGKRKILLCRGSYCYLAVIVRGRRPAAFSHRIRRSLGKVERAHWETIAMWDGRVEDLEGADDVLRRELMDVRLRTLARDLIDSAVDGMTLWMVSRLQRRSLERQAHAPGDLRSPRVRAARLLRRPESREMQPRYRGILFEALEQIQDGSFTFGAATNVYTALAVQKAPPPSVAAWWDEVLVTIRDVLDTWPWNPAAQAWVERRATRSVPAVSPARPDGGPLKTAEARTDATAAVPVGPAEPRE